MEPGAVKEAKGGVHVREKRGAALEAKGGMKMKMGQDKCAVLGAGHHSLFCAHRAVDSKIHSENASSRLQLARQ